jgi:2'-5' RNA ligase
VQFIEVCEGRDQVVALHERVMRVVSTAPQGRPFHPHVTVANRCPDGVLDHARLLTTGFDAWFTATSVTLFTRTTAAPHWTPVQAIDLGGSSGG